jgi:hypothetical protein
VVGCLEGKGAGKPQVSWRSELLGSRFGDAAHRVALLLGPTPANDDEEHSEKRGRDEYAYAQWSYRTPYLVGHDTPQLLLHVMFGGGSAGFKGAGGTR